jgi:hypothetical protein
VTFPLSKPQHVFDTLTASLKAMYAKGKAPNPAQFQPVASVWVPLALARLALVERGQQGMIKTMGEAVGMAARWDDAVRKLREMNVDLCKILAVHGIELTPEQGDKLGKLMAEVEVLIGNKTLN